MRARSALIAIIVAASSAGGAVLPEIAWAQAQQQAARALPSQAQGGQSSGQDLYARFLAELADPGAQYVVLSNHHRHDTGCTSRGCILMGPTEDREACREWASAYNTADPYDYARCVDAGDYISLQR